MQDNILNRVKRSLSHTTDNIIEIPRRLDDLELKFRQMSETIQILNETLRSLDDNTSRLHELEMESWFKKVDRKMKLATRDDVKNNKGDK